LIRAASPVPVIGFAGAPFTLASYLIEGRASRALERTKAMLLGEPVLWAALLERLVDLDVAYLRAQVEAGAQAIQLFDSWVGALAPRDYRTAVAPHMRRLFEGLAGLDVPIIHFGTGTTGLLEAMAAAGGDVIGLDWRVGLADGWSRVPDRAIQGNLDPAVLLADYAAAESATDAILDDAAGRPGHIFNLGHGVLPGTDPDHLRRLVDRVHARTSPIAVAG
jgi:uroporphyrinogen decarboxylase